MLFDHKSLIAGSGIPGKSGATFTPSVSQEGILSWSNDRGLENPEAVHIKGPKGDIGNTGPQGPPGDAAPIATTDAAGKVKPDGTTITVDPDGTIHSISSSANPEFISKTIPASSWIGEKAPYTSNELETTYPTSQYDLKLFWDRDNTDEEQMEALRAADIISNPYSNILSASGRKPAIDLKIIVGVSPRYINDRGDIE